MLQRVSHLSHLPVQVVDLNNAFSLNVSWDKMIQSVRDNKVSVNVTTHCDSMTVTCAGLTEPPLPPLLPLQPLLLLLLQVFMGAGAFTVTAERKQLINFTRPISVQPYQFLVVKPRELSRALLFTSPFTATVSCLPFPFPPPPQQNRNPQHNATPKFRENF